MWWKVFTARYELIRFIIRLSFVIKSLIAGMTNQMFGTVTNMYVNLFRFSRSNTRNNILKDFILSPSRFKDGVSNRTTFNTNFARIFEDCPNVTHLETELGEGMKVIIPMGAGVRVVLTLQPMDSSP